MFTRKGRNLAADDRIAISVTGRDNWVRSALFRGRVVKRVGGDAGREIIDRIFAKYTAARTRSARTARHCSSNRCM